MHNSKRWIFPWHSLSCCCCCFCLVASRSQPITWLHLSCVLQANHNMSFSCSGICVTILSYILYKKWNKRQQINAFVVFLSLLLLVWRQLSDHLSDVLLLLLLVDKEKTKVVVKSYNAINWNLGSEKLFDRVNFSVFMEIDPCTCQVAAIWYCQNHCHVNFNELNIENAKNSTISKIDLTFIASPAEW